MATDMETGIVAGLVAAGWTNNSTAASATATFAGQPADADTITLDSSGAGNKTYRFKSTMAAINDVQIGASAAITIGNLVAAITAGAGSGTKYFAGTTANATCTAVATSATVCTVSYLTSGSAGNGANIAKSAANISLSSSTLSGGANVLLSVKTPQNLQMSVNIHTSAGSFYNPGTTLIITPMSYDGTVVGPGVLSATPTASTTWKLIASKYQWFNLAVGTRVSTVKGNGVAMGTPYLTSNLVAPLIVSATAATPISCNVPSHGFSTGQNILVVNGLGLTGLNGAQTITVIDTNNFTLDGTTGVGTYTGNSASVTNITLGSSIAVAIWACGSSIGGPVNLRSSITVNNTCWQNVNNNTVDNSQGVDAPQLVSTVSNNVTRTDPQQWFDNTFLISEAFIAWGISSGATPKIIGQLWDSVLIRDALTIDQTAVFDSPSHTFWTVGTDTAGNSLMMATTS